MWFHTDDAVNVTYIEQITLVGQTPNVLCLISLGLCFIRSVLYCTVLYCTVALFNSFMLLFHIRRAEDIGCDKRWGPRSTLSESVSFRRAYDYCEDVLKGSRKHFL